MTCRVIGAGLVLAMALLVTGCGHRCCRPGSISSASPCCPPPPCCGDAGMPSPGVPSPGVQSFSQPPYNGFPR